MEEAALDTEPIRPKKKLGFIGGGNMATAIIEGLLKAKIYDVSQIYLSHPSGDKLKRFAYLNLANETADNLYVVKNSDVIVLCVKPQVLRSVCDEIRSLIDFKRQLIVSICAGVNVSKLVECLTSGSMELVSVRVARCMLNTAALVGASCSMYSSNGNLTHEDKDFVEQMLSSLGQSLGEFSDSEMDPAMAVSSCGIAYMFMMVDAMADGGVKMGLSRDKSLQLSMQTMKGAAELMQRQFGTKHHMQMKDEVCSAGGTTIQGVHELEKHGFRNAIICALEAATNRAKQL